MTSYAICEQNSFRFSLALWTCQKLDNVCQLRGCDQLEKFLRMCTMRSSITIRENSAQVRTNCRTTLQCPRIFKSHENFQDSILSICTGTHWSFFQDGGGAKNLHKHETSIFRRTCFPTCYFQDVSAKVHERTFRLFCNWKQHQTVDLIFLTSEGGGIPPVASLPRTHDYVPILHTITSNQFSHLHLLLVENSSSVIWRGHAAQPHSSDQKITCK